MMSIEGNENTTQSKKKRGKSTAVYLIPSLIDEHKIVKRFLKFTL